MMYFQLYSFWADKQFYGGCVPRYGGFSLLLLRGMAHVSPDPRKRWVCSRALGKQQDKKWAFLRVPHIFPELYVIKSVFSQSNLSLLFSILNLLKDLQTHYFPPSSLSADDFSSYFSGKQGPSGKSCLQLLPQHGHLPASVPLPSCPPLLSPTLLFPLAQGCFSDISPALSPSP